MFTDTENSFVLVKSWLGEHLDNLEKRMLLWKQRNGLCPRRV